MHRGAVRRPGGAGGRGRAAAAAAAAEAAGGPVVVGAGVAGLACALHLERAGVPCTLVEAGPTVGGRVQTDEVDGFLLDRGFQIFLTSYPEARAVLDYEALDLRPFYAGADVRFEGGFHRVADPLRHFADGLGSLANPIGSVPDKVLVGAYRLSCLFRSVDAILEAPETTMEARLREIGFSDAMVDRFFRPFLGGIFFNRRLTTTSRLFDFVMKMLATGSNCLPARGIGAVADQLAARLPRTDVRLNARVEAVEWDGAGGQSVRLADGTVLPAAGGLVVATEGPEAGRLLGERLAAAPSKADPAVGTACVYFKAASCPTEEPMLFLDGDGGSIVNNCCFPTAVAATYGPAGATLVSASTVGTFPDLSDAELAERVRGELGGWFGAAETAGWELLRVYRIPYSQPNQTPPTDLTRDVRLAKGLYVCGDHRYSATLDGALVSGRKPAEALLADYAGR